MQNPQDISNWAALSADVACLIIPGATGGGTAVRAANIADDVIDAGRAVKAADRAGDAVEAGNHAVYRLVDSSGNPQYVGRTIDIKARSEAHQKNPARKHLQFEVIEKNLSYSAARGIEQTYILHYGTINRNNPMNNQINGISLKNQNLEVYMDAAKIALGNEWNNVSKEILLWSGN